MLTKQARQFEQWANERDQLMAKKAKQVPKKVKKLHSEDLRKKK